MDIGQSIITAAVTIGELFVVQPHEMHDGRVQIVHVHAVLHSAHSKVTGRPMGVPWLDPATG